jgi:hypothetical protein
VVAPRPRGSHGEWVRAGGLRPAGQLRAAAGAAADGAAAAAAERVLRAGLGRGRVALDQLQQLLLRVQDGRPPRLVRQVARAINLGEAERDLDNYVGWTETETLAGGTSGGANGWVEGWEDCTGEVAGADVCP